MQPDRTNIAHIEDLGTDYVIHRFRLVVADTAGLIDRFTSAIILRIQKVFPF